MGIRTVMVTGDNRVTAAAIATEAGVDDFIAQATPQDKLDYIRRVQAEGRLVAMAGDGTNDAPALAQADVGVAMQTGTQAAREAANMVDLDSDPTKLIEVVEIGKQLLITRGALTTFSIANDVSKYFAILPAIFVATYPELDALNVMRLTFAIQRDHVGGDLQRADHRRPGSAGAPRRALRAGGCSGAAAAQLADLWPGRADRTVHRHQADRPHSDRARSGLKEAVPCRPCVQPSVLVVVFTLLTGLAFPLAFVGFGQAVFPDQANGSLIRRNGHVVGSALIGQDFTADRYFHPRPSATTGTDPNDPSKTIAAPYAAANSGGSNLGPTSKALLERVQADLRDQGPLPVPGDAVTSSASGLDPQISPANAERQIARVATARHMAEAELRDLLTRETRDRRLGFIGEPRVNVLELNLALDDLQGRQPGAPTQVTR